MLPCETLFRLLLVGVCLCVFGNTVQDIQKENEHSLGGRSLRIVGPTKDSLDAESKPGARKKFWRMFDRENIYKAVLKRTLRDTLGNINAMLYEEARRTSSIRAPNPTSPIPTPVSLTTQTVTLFSTWERQGPVMPTSPELFFPDIGEDSILKEDSVEGLWTEAPRPSGDTAPPPSQDDTTEVTMSSESLPLIFEPLEESVTQLPAAVMATAVMLLSGTDLERVVATETDKPPRTGSLIMADGQLLDTSNQSGSVQMSELTDTVQTSTLDTMATYLPVPKPQSDLEGRTLRVNRKDDDPDEDESSEELMEDEGSEEDPTETAQTQPPYSLIPPPPVWVQHNQGLMHSWVALIREKVGYISGMLAPVGIGMAGALLLVGALYSMRRIQQRRRNSFKRQRRKVRPAEQPGETCAGRQDQAMLLVADSSEDEF